MPLALVCVNCSAIRSNSWRRGFLGNRVVSNIEEYAKDMEEMINLFFPEGAREVSPPSKAREELMERLALKYPRCVCTTFTLQNDPVERVFDGLQCDKCESQYRTVDSTRAMICDYPQYGSHKALMNRIIEYRDKFTLIPWVEDPLLSFSACGFLLGGILHLNKHHSTPCGGTEFTPDNEF